MTRALHLPDTGRAGASHGKLWRKQVLPLGSIDYDGRRITFDGAYLDSLVKAFNDGAYDQVPLQFADAENRHTDDPERTRGEIVALERTEGGLDALVRLSPAGEETVKANPKLAVSARIVEDLRRADGRRFPRALAHVLATLNPRLTGMRPWAAVSLADPSVPVVDLTGGTYSQGGSTMELTDEQVQRLLALLDDKGTNEPTGTTPTASDEPSDEPSDEELAAMLAELMGEGEPQATPPVEPEPVGVGAALSVEAKAAIDLAVSQGNAAQVELAELRSRLAASDWAATRTQLEQDGVPPYLLDLAAPVMSSRPGTIDLANPPADDPRATVAKMLHASRGTVDFSILGVSDTDDPADPADKLVGEFLEQFNPTL